MTQIDRDETETLELVEKLGGMCGKIIASGLFPPRDVAASFFAVGLAIARNDQGSVQTAEWLRGIADDIERAELH